MISIRTLKICGKSICGPLEIICNECISNGVFPSEWKKGNVVSVLVPTNSWQNIRTFDI